MSEDKDLCGLKERSEPCILCHLGGGAGKGIPILCYISAGRMCVGEQWGLVFEKYIEATLASVLHGCKNQDSHTVFEVLRAILPNIS